MAIFTLSMEDDEIQVPQEPLDLTPDTTGDLNDIQEQAEIIQTENDLIVSSSLQDVAATGLETEEVLDQIEAAQTPEEGLRIAQEYLLSKVGYTKEYSAEDFTDKLNTNLSIAQEGIGKRFINGVVRLFKTDKRILQDLQKFLEVLKEKGTREGDIKEPGWGRAFSFGVKSRVTAREVIAIVDKIHSIISSAQYDNLVRKIIADIESIQNEVAKNTFTTKPETMNRIDAIEKVIDSNLSKLRQLIVVGPTRLKTDPDYEPLQYSDATHLVDKVHSLFDYQNARYELLSRIWNLTYDTMESDNIQTGNQWINSIASSAIKLARPDRQALQRILSKVDDALNGVLELEIITSKAIYSVSRYIKHSAAV